jgi:YesN/AraC family two-component response regulator
MARVLIVDDEERVREVLCEVLRGHTCHTAPSAEQALSLLGENEYDVVVTDISLPGMSGVELFGRVMGRLPDTPVIFISGISDEAYARGLIRMGAFAYIEKPPSLEVVEETVDRAAALHEKLARLSRETFPDSAEPPTEELMKLERDWAEAYRRRDPELLDRVWGDDFMLTNASGELKNKRQAVSDVVGETRFEFFTTFDVRGNVFGDVAVATGRLLVKGEYKGEDVTGQYRYTNTYARQGGRWRAIASHITRADLL